MLVCIPAVLDWSELKKVRAAIAEGSFEDGRRTAGRRAKRVKNNLQLKKGDDRGREIRDIVLAALRRNPTFRRVAIPRTIRPPLISRYQEGMSYGLHVDDALMGATRKERSDLSVTVALSDPGEYDGGELVIHGALGEQEVKLPAGTAVVYPSCCLHRVAPVTRGERLAAVTWVQSYVRETAKREVLHDLELIREKLSAAAPDTEEADLAAKTYANLLRMWSEP